MDGTEQRVTAAVCIEAVVVGTGGGIRLSRRLARGAASARQLEEAFRSGLPVEGRVEGATLMGFDGVVAVGCTIGQGVTGVSTLSRMSFVVLTSIIAGAAITMKIQYALMMRSA